MKFKQWYFMHRSLLVRVANFFLLGKKPKAILNTLLAVLDAYFMQAGSPGVDDVQHTDYTAFVHLDDMEVNAA